ncbi:MAG: hypothetical protein AAFV53_10135 [Myxococcota bacterium]
MLFTVLLSMIPRAEAYGAWCADHNWMDVVYNPIKTVRHDSVLAPAERYGARLAFDGDLSTAWCEGEAGHGEGKGITVVIDQPRTLVAVEIHGGYFKSPALLTANSRVRQMTMTASHGTSGQMFTSTLTLADPAAVPAKDPCDPSGETPMDATRWYTLTRDNPGARAYSNLESGQSMPVDVIELDLSAVFPGSKYTDTCISEIKLIMRD